MIYAVAVVAVLANPLTVPNLPEVLADLGQPDSRAGLLISVVPLPGVLAAPAMALLANRFGRRSVVVWCLVLFGTAGAASALAPNFPSLLGLRFLQGIGSAGLISLSVVLIGDHWSGADRTRLLGRNAAAISTGLLAAPLVAGALAEQTNWRWSVALSAVALPLAWICAFRLPADSGSAIATGTLSSQFAAIRAPGIPATLVSGFVLAAVVFGVFFTTVPLHVDNEFRAGPSLRGLLLSLPSAAGAIAALRLGWFRRRASIRQTLVWSTVVVALSVVVTGLAPSLLVIALSSTAFGLASGISNPTLQDFAAAAALPHQLPMVLAAWVSIMRLGQAVGPLAAGRLLEVSSTTTTILVCAIPLGVLAVGLKLGPIDGPKQL